MYCKAPGRSFQDNPHCVRHAVPEGKTYPGAKLILTPSATPEPLLIDENTIGRQVRQVQRLAPFGYLMFLLQVLPKLGVLRPGAATPPVALGR